MNIIAFLLVGLLSGWIASSLMEGRGAGILRDLIIGVIGAFVGGFVFSIFGVFTYGFLGSLVMSVVGAMVFLLLVRMFTGHHHSH